jgi:lysophospholipase L1-like esterase
MFLVLPCLPILFYESKRVRSLIPKLPDAKSPEGVIQSEGLDTIRLILLGESTVAGIGVDKHEFGLPGSTSRHLSDGLNVNVSWRAYGRSGYNSKRIMEETVPEMELENVDLIGIALGGNDAFELNTPWGWQRDIRRLIQALKGKFPNSKIAFMHMPPIKEFTAFTKTMKWALGHLVEIFGDVLAQEIPKHANVYFHHQIVTLKVWREQTKSNLSADALFSDGVHPSKLNYELWGKEFGQWVIDQGILKK